MKPQTITEAIVLLRKQQDLIDSLISLRKQQSIIDELVILRKQQGLSRLDIAVKAGWSEFMVGHIERQYGTINVSTLIRYANAIGAKIHVYLPNNTES